MAGVLIFTNTLQVRHEEAIGWELVLQWWHVCCWFGQQGESFLTNWIKTLLEELKQGLFKKTLWLMSFSADHFKYCMKMDDRCDQAGVVDPVSGKCKRLFQWNYKNRNKTGYVGESKCTVCVPYFQYLSFKKNKMKGMARPTWSCSKQDSIL